MKPSRQPSARLSLPGFRAFFRPAVWLRAGAGALAVFFLSGCLMLSHAPPQARLSRGRPVAIETTAYCPCGKCCGWKRNWLFRPVVASGPNRGKPKAVGMTASGKKAKPGTIAADTRYYPMGTVLYVPGYGYGVVEDRGGDIKGPQRLDLFFNKHSEALTFGRKKLYVVVFPPGTRPVPHKIRPVR